MRGSERRRELRGHRCRWSVEAVEQAVGWRQRSDTDQQTTDLLDALLGHARFTRDELTRLVHEGDDPGALARTAEALERAGTTAPQHDLLPQVRAALTRLGLVVNRQSVLDGFVGRQSELATVSEWAQTPRRPPYHDPLRPGPARHRQVDPPRRDRGPAGARVPGLAGRPARLRPGGARRPGLAGAHPRARPAGGRPGRPGRRRSC